MTRILFVCLGNICRSPLAEGLFRQHVEAAGLTDQFEMDSAGTGNWHAGELPDPRTRANAANHGLTLAHRARQITRHDLNHYDYLVCMDQNNLANVQRLTAAAKRTGKLILMRAYDPKGPGDVPDPYQGGPADFELVFQILNRSTKAMLQELVTYHTRLTEAGQ